MMWKFTNRLLAQSFYWFGLVCGLFGVLTQMSGEPLFASPFFYLEVGMLSMLAGIFLAHQER